MRTFYNYDAKWSVTHIMSLDHTRPKNTLGRWRDKCNRVPEKQQFGHKYTLQRKIASNYAHCDRYQHPLEYYLRITADNKLNKLLSAAYSHRCKKTLTPRIKNVRKRVFIKKIKRNVKNVE